MIFTSFTFATFLPAVFVLYWFIFSKNIRLQNFFLIVVSYIFYGWWNWKFPVILVFITITDYFIAHRIYSSNLLKTKRLYLSLSLLIDIGMLFLFKYYNFFLVEFTRHFAFIGVQLPVLNFILPLGISFYIFTSLSYIFDVYHEEIEPVTDFTAYASFMSFFPKFNNGTN